MRHLRQAANKFYTIRSRGRSYLGKSILPSDIPNLFAWFDASDTSTITVSSGFAVGWDDKSGNGYHAAQPTAANQPATGTRTLNGLNVLDFDGTNDRMQLNSGMYSLPNGNNTVVAVFVSDDVSSTEQRIFGATNGTSRYYLARNQSAGNLRAANRTTNAYAEISAIPTSITQNIAALRRSGSVINAYYNRTKSTDAVAASFTSVNGQIGATTDGNLFNGAIAELIFYNRALTDAEMNKLFYSLSRKWATPW